MSGRRVRRRCARRSADVVGRRRAEGGERRCGGRGGFLLAEALVTLALSAMILVGLASLIGLLLRAQDRAASAAEAQEVSSRLVAVLRRDISAAAPVRWAGRDASFVFDGQPDRLVFAVAGRTGVEAVALEAEPVAGGTRLLRAEFALPPSARGLGDITVPDAVEVFRSAAPISFRYAGRITPDAEESVSASWPSGPSQPSAVLVGVGALDLRIAFAITAEPGCAAKDTPCSLRPSSKREDAPEPAEAEGGEE